MQTTVKERFYQESTKDVNGPLSLRYIAPSNPFHLVMVQWKSQFVSILY